MLKFVQKGLPSKYNAAAGKDKYEGKEQLYIPRSDNYYQNKSPVESPSHVSLDRSRDYLNSAGGGPRQEPQHTVVSPSSSGTYPHRANVDQYSARYTDSNANQHHQASPRSPRSPGETEISVPVYGTRAQDRYPAAAESRLVYSSKPNTTFGYAQSRPTGDQSPPPPPPPPLNIPTEPPLPPPPSYPQYMKSSSLSPTYPPPSPTYPQPPDSPKYPLDRNYQLAPTMEGGGVGVKDSGKEQEVDALTNLLMQNMEAAADPDFFGMCAKCGRAIMGELDGCKALDQLFHVDCFTCISCSLCLKGHPFYAMEGRPYCEPCYVMTLEKCSVCSKPITDRILRATGKPYHPACFKCVVCNTNLDGVPFTVDATNQIHCIEDFHRKFAPRCCVCDLPIMPQGGSEEAVRIVAMDRSFHPHCYKCEDCDVILTSEADGRGCYPLNETMLCKHCNARRIQHMTSRLPTEVWDA